MKGAIDLKIGLVIWNKLIKEGIELYFRKSGNNILEKINPDRSAYSKDMISKLKMIDIWLIEASNPDFHRDAAGFRFARTLLKLGISKKVIVIFKALEGEFLNYPCFADYGSIHLIPEKIASIMKSAIDNDPFRLIIQKYPYLDKLPVHKKVI